MSAPSAVERVHAAYAAIERVDRPEIWITLRPLADALADAVRVDAAARTGAELPLAGLVAAVKNNIDVAGIPTTAGCPTFATCAATADAPAVARLRTAGAVVIGATNLDQFATGLVGTRSPYGAVRDARRPDRISGGSSSGSAVAVALGLVDVALGTDTAGSGRVPAALQGIVGIKPTIGVVPTDGVVPACRSYDCVTVFARDLDTADAAMGVLAGGGRPFPPDAPLTVPPTTRVAVPGRLPGLSPAWRQAFESACERLAGNGIELVEVDLTPFLQAATLLYDGGLVAERHAAVGTFVDEHLAAGDPALDPTVAQIISAAGAVPATTLLRDRARLAELTASALARLGDCAALLIPTTTEHPSIAEVAADPVGVNSRLGTYTNFCNLMDLCAVAVPAGTTSDGAQFGVTVLGRAGADALALDLARLVSAPVDGAAPPGVPAPPTPAVPWPARAGTPVSRLLVVGAHRRGGPLAWQLEQRGARRLGPATTAPLYLLTRLPTEPAKPGLVRVGPATGTAIEGELWLIGTAMLGDFLAELPDPMTLGAVTLADGTEAVGFGCTVQSWLDGEDITHHGDWFGYLRRTTPGDPVSRADVTGRVWRRAALVEPGRPMDTGTEVEWLQGHRLYIDLRTVTDGDRHRAAAAFAGTLRRDGDTWTWEHEFDLHPGPAPADRGLLHRAGSVLVETGVDREYHEDWVAAHTGAVRVEARFADDTGHGMLLRIGDRFGYLRHSPGSHAHRAAGSACLEISLGVVEAGHWHITRSTHPARIGDDLAPEFSDRGLTVTDRTPGGRPARRRLTVTFDHLPTRQEV